MAKHIDEFESATALSGTNRVAIQVCNKQGLALATYVAGCEVDASADGPMMGVREPHEVSSFPSFAPIPAIFKTGAWDEDRRRFMPFQDWPQFRHLEELRIWLEKR